MTEPKTGRGGARPGSGRPPKNPNEPLITQISLRITQRQSDYLLCASAVKLDPQDIVRAALDEYIERLTGQQK